MVTIGKTVGQTPSYKIFVGLCLHESAMKNLFKNYNSVWFIEIVLRDFEVCFLMPLDCSDIATPDRTGWLFK
jgi:hypothetical protein